MGWKRCGSALIRWERLRPRFESMFPEAGSSPAVNDRDDFNPVVNYSIHDDIGKSLQQVPARSIQVPAPQQRRPSNYFAGPLKLNPECIGGQLAALGISIVCIDNVDPRVRVRFQRIVNHARGRATHPSGHPTESAGLRLYRSPRPVAEFQRPNTHPCLRWFRYRDSESRSRRYPRARTRVAPKQFK